MAATTFSPSPMRGSLPAIPSKSAAHRLLIAAALADQPTEIEFGGTRSADIDATVRCLQVLGTNIVIKSGKFEVTPQEAMAVPAVFDCGESGSTLRFMLPVAAVRLSHGRTAVFQGAGRLPSRPLGDLCEALRRHGCRLSGDSLPLTVEGPLHGGEFVLPGDVSSQYITGLLFALPMTAAGGRIRLSTALQSADYVRMTLRTLETFGITVQEQEDGWQVSGGQHYRSPRTVKVEGDWSNAAVMLCAGALSGSVTVTGLDPASGQGDRRIVDMLRRFGAAVTMTAEGVTAEARPLHGVTMDMGENPDLLPVLAVVAAAARGRTVLHNAGRVRLKESDRLAAMAAMLRTSGVPVTETAEALAIDGGGPLHGGLVDVCNDHRLVMAAALLGLMAKEGIQVTDIQSVRKSYPDFAMDWSRLQQRKG